MIKFLKQQLGHDAHPVAQFIKYGFVGGLATGINIAVFFVLGWTLLPCLTEDDIMVKLLGLAVEPVTEAVRKWNAGFCSGVGFVVSNTVCYILNRLFVFKPGRHGVVKECALFFAVSGVSWGIGTAIQTQLIAAWGVQTSLAFGANIFTALLINYAMRKFVIFKG
ncbi:MAG: GtrA family protein [Kiritimatiellaeota bacterium]|nr:GtrA family protein [Kiritimatiellota bacterium]